MPQLDRLRIHTHAQAFAPVAHEQLPTVPQAAQHAREWLYAAVDAEFNRMGRAMDTQGACDVLMDGVRGNGACIDLRHLGQEMASLLVETDVWHALLALSQERVGAAGRVDVMLPQGLTENLAFRIRKSLRDIPELEVLAAKPGARHTWLPQQRWVWCVIEDTVNRRAAKTCAIRYGVPERNCFYSERRESGRGNPPGALATPGALSSIGLSDRLDVFAHGNPYELGGMDPAQLAQRLKLLGLDQVGVLRLESCSVGFRGYMEELRGAMSENGIRVGYIVGYTGDVANYRSVATIFGKRYCVNFMRPVAPLCFWSPSLFMALAGGKVVNNEPADRSKRVVKGNTHIVFDGTRYNLPEVAASAARTP